MISGCVILAALVTLASPADSLACERPRHLRFSVVPDGDVQTALKNYQPILDDLQSSLGIPVEVFTPSSYGAVIEGLLSGSIDVARLGPASYVSAKASDPDITAFSTFAQKRGAFDDEGAFYYSLLVVRTETPFKTAEDLRGKTLALVDPDSTSGNKIPRQLFSRVIGIPLERHFGRISYAGSHPLAAAALLQGRVDAAFVSSANLTTLVTEGKMHKEDVRVLWRSMPIPMDPFVYRGSFCRDVQDKIRAAFLDQRKSSATVLKSMNAIRFVPVRDRDYQVIKDLL